MTRDSKLTDDDYRRLLEFRTAIRKFLSYSKTQAEGHGLTPTQHQLLLAIRGLGDKARPTISEIAECLLIKHHSAVELIDRAEVGGLIRRHSDRNDHRVVRLSLSPSGARKLERISTANLAQLGRLGNEFHDVWKAIERLAV